MHNRGRIGMYEAAEALVASRKAKSARHAREAIVSALMLEKFIACCDAYWINSIPPISRKERVRVDHTPWEREVPADFWLLDHAQDYPWNPSGGVVPTGSWGAWLPRDPSRFCREVALTGSAAAHRYADFAELAEMGSKPVTLKWTAIGVSVHTVDIERLIDAGGFNALIRRAKQIPSIRWGNISKSDALRVIARYCAISLSISDQEDIASSPQEVMKLLLNTSATVSEDAVVSDRVLKAFADLLAEEAAKQSRQAALIAPAS